MITYELAKKLKDAGFKQETAPISLYVWIDGAHAPYKLVDGYKDILNIKNCAYCPSLSELIEACGEWFFTLIKMPGEEWRINEPKPYTSITRQMVNGTEYIIGKTPEEAVAKLWLKLNKND